MGMWRGGVDCVKLNSAIGMYIFLLISYICCMVVLLNMINTL